MKCPLAGFSKGAVRKIGNPFRGLVAQGRRCSQLPSLEECAHCRSNSHTEVALIRYRKPEFLIRRRILNVVAGAASLSLEEVRLGYAQLVPVPHSPDPF